MRLYLSTAILTLAWFSAINAAASSGVWLAARVVLRRSNARGARPGAQAIFALRMAPLAASSLFAFGVFLPVHWASEAREGSEYFGVVLCGLALLGAVLLAGSASRVLTALRACRRLRLDWSGQAGDARRIVHDNALPGISLAGILRTTIVVGAPVREALTPEELEVALEHEIAHRESRDNLKRFAIFAAPDLFGGTRVARDLEQVWSAEVECLADARAVGGDPSRSANLASALVKVARIAGAATRDQSMPLWSTFYESALLELRVHRLVDGSAVPARPSRLLPAGLLTTAALMVWGAWTAALPLTLHVMTEALVQLLP